MDMLSWIIIIYSASCVEFHITAHARLKTGVKPSLYISQTMQKISVSIGRVQLQFGAPSPSRKGIAGIQSNLADSDAHASTRGGHLSICRLDYSASPFQNAFLLCEETYCASFSHHLTLAHFGHWKKPSFLGSLNLPIFFLFACQCQTGNFICNRFHDSGDVCSVTWLAGSSASYTDSK